MARFICRALTRCDFLEASSGSLVASGLAACVRPGEEPGEDSLPREEMFARSESVGGGQWYAAKCEDKAHPLPKALKTNRERFREFGR